MTRLYTAASVALAFAGVLSLSMVDAQAGKQARRFKERKDLVVTLVTPTNNQEVLPDLSDPGLNNVITVRFSSSLRPRDVINPNNVFNRLSNKVEFLDANFARMPGTPRVRRNVFTFDPRTETNGGLLPNGQYTINLRRTLRNRRGRTLNKGVRDFTSTFSVGTDVYSPVLRKISPIQGQRNIGLTQRIIATFNEPIDPNSAIATVQVQDASINPPAAIPGAGGSAGVTVERNGFDLVFTPDPCFGYPPNTTIQLLIQGLDHPVPPAVPSATPLTDQFGNPFDRDPGLQWALNIATGLYESPNGSYRESSGEFRMTFQTKGVRPQPVGLIPGSPQNTVNLGGTPCSVASWFAPSCAFAGNVIFYTTSNGLGEVSMQAFINRFNQGITDLTLFSVVPNSPARQGRPGTGFLVDPRWDPTILHTYLYLVDERTRTVKVLDSRNLSTLGRFGGVVQPRDLTISTDGGLNRTTLWISDFGASSVVGLDLQAITVNLIGGQPGAPSPCEAIKDNQNRRVVIQTGRGPTGVAANSYFLSRVMVCNTLDGSVTQINPRDNSIINTLDVGSSPVDCDWSLFGGAGDICMIANQGGLNDPNGSITLYVRTGPTGDFRNGFISAAQQRDGIESSLTDGVNNPTGIWGNQQWSGGGFSIPTVWYAANTGGKTVMQLNLSSTGAFGLFAVSFIPGVVSTAEVGFNPTSAMTDSFYPGAFALAAVAGTGQLAVWDPARPLNPTMNNVPGIRRIFTCFSH